MFARAGCSGILAEHASDSHGDGRGVAGLTLGPSVLGSISPQLQGQLLPFGLLPAVWNAANLGLIFLHVPDRPRRRPEPAQRRVARSVAISNTSVALPMLMGHRVAIPLYTLLAPEGSSRRSPLFPSVSRCRSRRPPLLAGSSRSYRMLRRTVSSAWRAQRSNDARTGIQTQTGAAGPTRWTGGHHKTRSGWDNTLLNQVNPVMLRRWRVLLLAVSTSAANITPAYLVTDHPARGHQRVRPVARSRLISSMSPEHRAFAGRIWTANGRHHRYHYQERRPGSGRVGVDVRGKPWNGRAEFQLCGVFLLVNYFRTGDYLRTTLGPRVAGRQLQSDPDDTKQYHGFAYLEDVVTPTTGLR